MHVNEGSKDCSIVTTRVQKKLNATMDLSMPERKERKNKERKKIGKERRRLRVSQRRRSMNGER